MKIGQIVIDLYFNSELGKFYVTAAQEEVQQGSQSTAKVENSTTMFPEEVHLDPDSDTFVEDKAALKQKGYFFNRSSKTWRKKKGSAEADTNGSKSRRRQAVGSAMRQRLLCRKTTTTSMRRRQN